MRLDEVWGEIDKKAVIGLVVALIVVVLLYFGVPPLFEDEMIEEFIQSILTDAISTCLIFAFPYLVIDGMNRRKTKQREEALLAEIEKRVACLIEEHQKNLLYEMNLSMTSTIEKNRASANNVASRNSDIDL